MGEAVWEMEQNYMKLRENKSESVMQHSFSLEQAHIQDQ